MSTHTVSTPTHERCVTSYAARTQYKPGVVHPPHIKVKDAIDIHCHTHEGQQDPYDLARRASLAEMKGLLFKSIPGDDPVQATQAVQDDVNRWAEKQEGVKPINCWSAYVCGRQMAPVTAKTVSEMIDRGVGAIWLPVFTHAITMSTVGTYGRFVRGRENAGWVGPIGWDEAMKIGHYDLDDNGKLKPEIRDIVHLCADRNVALFFGHATHAEIYKLAEEVQKAGLKRAVIDHPFSPFLNVATGHDERNPRHAACYLTSPGTNSRRCWASTRRSCTTPSAKSASSISRFPAMPANRCSPTPSKPCAWCAATWKRSG